MDSGVNSWSARRILMWVIISLSVMALMIKLPGTVRWNEQVLTHKLQASEDDLRVTYEEWPAFTTKTKYSTKWYKENCFLKNYTWSLGDMFNFQIPHWSKSDVEGCKETYEQFKLLYEVHIRYSPPLTFPPPFADRVKKWLNGDATLLKEVHHQQIIHVYHPLTSEHVVYNPVRSKRPMPAQPIDLFKWVDKQSEESAKSCDFCNVASNTAEDALGRNKKAHTIRVSNTFKLERWHTMVLTRHQHHPLNYTLPTFIAFFDDCWKLAQEVEAKDKQFIYSNLAWDSLHQGGASQLHPHIHVMMSPDHYYGFMEKVRSSGQRYYNAVGKNYFSTVLELHEALGLTVHYGNSVAIAMLVGKADMEVMFFSKSPGPDFYRLIYYTTKAYHDTFTQLCKSFAAAYPAVGNSEAAKLGRIPAIGRLMSRGDCPSPRTDYTSCEIYQVTSINHDPWQVAKAIRKAIKKYDP